MTPPVTAKRSCFAATMPFAGPETGLASTIDARPRAKLVRVKILRLRACKCIFATFSTQGLKSCVASSPKGLPGHPTVVLTVPQLRGILHSYPGRWWPW